jgi:hypothetical protein
MPKKPISIIIFSLIYALSPVFILAQAAVMANLPLIGRISIVQRLSLLDCVILALYLACAVSIFSVKRWGWYLFMLSSLALVAHNVYVASLRQGPYGILLVLAYDIVLACAAGFFFRRKVIAPYFNPRMRWWETLPRYQALSYVLIGASDSRFSANIIDISASGCFILTDRKLATGSDFPLEVHCFGEDIALSARVMRKADYHGTTGYGLMFVRPGELASRALNVLARRLSRSGLTSQPWEGSASSKDGPAPRYDTGNEASIIVAGKSYWASIVDLSKRGCLLMANCDAPLGEKYSLSLRCMRDDLALEGVVRWKLAGGKANLIGIALDLSDKAKSKRVADWVKKLKRTGALERSVQNAALGDQTVLEYALKSPYRFLWKLSRIFRKGA